MSMPLPRNDPNHTSDKALYILDGILLPGNGLLPIWRGNRLDLYNGSLFGVDNQALLGGPNYCLAFDLHRSELRLYEFDLNLPPDLIADPVRLQLEESLTGPVVDASISFTLFNRGQLNVDATYSIGSRLEPYTSLYRFFINTIDPNRGLVDYTGETYLRRLDRIPATRQVLLPPNGGPYTPKQCLQAILDTYGVNYAPLPELRLLGAEGPFVIDTPGYAYFPPKAEDKTEPPSLLELIQRAVAPFEGYYLRINPFTNSLMLVPPPWAPEATAGPTLANADVLEIDPGEIDPSTVVNRCTVKSQGFSFTASPVAVMEPASFGFRGSLDPSKGADPLFTVLYPTPAELTGKKLNDAPIVYGKETRRGTLAIWPLQAQTVLGDQTLQVNWVLTTWIYEAGTGQYGGTTGYPKSGSKTIPLDGSSVELFKESVQLGAPLSYGHVWVYAAWDAQAQGVRLDYDLYLYSQSIGFGGSGIIVYGVRVELNGLARKLDKGDVVVATFGEVYDSAPGLSLSQSRYGLRQKTLDIDYQLTPDQAMAIAQNQVEKGLNPKQIYRVRQAANMRVRPEHLGRRVYIPRPDGAPGLLEGTVRAWRYLEAHSTGGVQADSEFELEVTRNVFGDVTNFTQYGEAIYGLSAYL